MKTFNFNIAQPNPDYFFHKITNHNDQYKITGWDRTKSIEVGDEIQIKNRVWLVDSISYRSHAGVFENNSDKVGTFFEAKSTLIKIIKVN